MVRRWSCLNFINNFSPISYLNYQHISKHQNVYSSRLFLEKNISITTFSRTKMLRRKHKNKLFFYQIPLLHWSKEYRSFRFLLGLTFSKRIFQINIAQTNKINWKNYKPSLDYFTNLVISTPCQGAFNNFKANSLRKLFFNTNLYYELSMTKENFNKTSSQEEKGFDVHLGSFNTFFFYKKFLQEKLNHLLIVSLFLNQTLLFTKLYKKIITTMILK